MNSDGLLVLSPAADLVTPTTELRDRSFDSPFFSLKRRTEITGAGVPNETISWLAYVHQATKMAIRTPPYTLEYDSGRIFGANICGVWNTFDPLPNHASTTVNLTSLLQALFQHLRRDADIQPPLRSYFACTTLSLQPLSKLEFHAAPLVIEQSKSQELGSREIANSLATFLDVSLEKLGEMADIGRTTFSSWSTKIPRKSTVRDLNRIYSVVEALRTKLGDQATKVWLRNGEPAPFDLLCAQNIVRFEQVASPLLFSSIEPSPSMTVSGYDLSDIPKSAASGTIMRAKTRAIRGRLSSED